MDGNAVDVIIKCPECKLVLTFGIPVTNLEAVEKFQRLWIKYEGIIERLKSWGYW